jgi:methylated-DNA-[protein]-cysteine S-methyltransferase
MIRKDFDASAQFDSPIGLIALYAKNEKIVFLTMGADAIAPLGKAKVLAEAEKQLKRYFAGKSKVLDLAVDLQGTDFQKAVWAQIAKIGFGETKTYADIAAAIGKPKGSRAVGGAVGANPVPLIVGCHRVLGASGKITGYSGGDGLPTKRWLLRLEGLTAKE